LPLNVTHAETAAKIRAIAAKQQVQESVDWLEVKRLKQDLELQRKAKMSELIREMSVEQVIAFEENDEKRADLLKMYQMKLQSGMSSQQILATLGKSDRNDEFMNKMAELYRDNAERSDKNFSRLVDPLRVGVGGNIYRDDRNMAYEDKNRPSYNP
jgi:hypothetical protein